MSVCAHVNKKKRIQKQTKKRCQNSVRRLGECATLYLSKVLPFFLQHKDGNSFCTEQNPARLLAFLVSFFHLLLFLYSSHTVFPFVFVLFFLFSLFSLLTRRVACCCRKGKRRKTRIKNMTEQNMTSECGDGWFNHPFCDTAS